MRATDFFIDNPELDAIFGTSTPRFNATLVQQLRRGPLPERDDIEVAVALARLIHDQLQAYGTDGSEELNDDDMREALHALQAVLARLAIDDFEVPFRNLSGFRRWWVNNGAHGSWQARRDLLSDLFDPLHDRLADIEQRTLESELAEPVSPHARTGWAAVDTEISELRRHFRTARTAQDYRNVGQDCVAVTEALSRTVYDPARHLREGEEEPAVGKTKQRIERFIEDAAPGPDNAILRRLARAAVDYAQHVKHSQTPTRREAGIAADAVIQLANILRRLDEEE